VSVHRCVNLTPFAGAIGVAQDLDGRELAVAVLKATFRFGARGEVAPAPPEAQRPVARADAHLGDPGLTGLTVATDVSPPKPGTDVAVAGHAYGRGKKEIEAGFRIGKLEKIVAVSGPRVWVATRPVTVAGPVAFEKIPLQYEQAFGGAYDDPEGRRVSYTENPAGVGFARAVVDRAPLPSIEHPNGRFRSPKDRPSPAGLGFIPPGWKRRARFAGTFDDAWERSRRPLLPADLDERFWNTVPQDQVLQPKLAGGETLVLLNVHPEAPTVALVVPRLAFTAAFRLKGTETVLPMTADTLLVEPDEGRFSIAFRAVLVVGDDLRRLEAVVFKASRGAVDASPGPPRPVVPAGAPARSR